jgi:hypothetical protein
MAEYGAVTLEEITRFMAERGLLLGQALEPRPPGWVSTATHAQLRGYLSEREVSERKRRLFACACCRSAWALLGDDRSRQAVEVAERCADGQASLAELQQARLAAYYATREDRSDAVRAAYYAVIDDARLAAEHASFRARRADWEARQLAWLRDLLGGPGSPPGLESVRAWNSGCVVKLSRAMYEERRFEDLPVLADALEEAGCTDAEVLTHCRLPGDHVRGCWVVDLLLGRR